ncbi:MAG: Verru_Chthon cassette protein A [Verrucomicrobiota bacterium]
MRAQPWQTLLFSPNPQAGSAHPGLSVPNPFSITGSAPVRPLTKIPDHLLLDLFTMPVAEPYAISEPLSTAGKVNLNYQIAPFSYIQRKTGLYAVLKSLKIPIFVGSQAAAYKSMGLMMNGLSSIRNDSLHASTKYSCNTYDVPGYPLVPGEKIFPGSTSMPGKQRTLFDINISETLKGFDDLFNAGEAFRSASEICDMFLVPDPTATDPEGTIAPSGIPTTLAATKTWWSTTGTTSPIITADNLREAPYNQIYPRITTKSNTYTVHMRVQALKQVPNRASWGTWNEATDQVVSEYRGSATIERYVDPNDPTIPDFTDPANSSKNLAPYYRWRTVAERQFIP